MNPPFERFAARALHEPVMVVALEGWIDAGGAAAMVTRLLLEQWPREPLARFDAEQFLDYRARRPVMRLVDGVNTGLTWAETEMFAARDNAGNDAVLLVGAEPDMAWRRFVDAVVTLAGELQVRLVTSVGAYPAPIPHSRASAVVATATTAELAEQVGYLGGVIDIPAGITAAIERGCAEAGIPAVGLWAQVPHYVSAMSYPPAAVALVEALAGVPGLHCDPGPLREEALATRQRLDRLVAASDEHAELVTQLEIQYDTTHDDVDGPLPSGDELAAELERFLRDNRGDVGG